jgi:NAD(P)-dependent dehydrogenase (short-subunit alcohol dehydrogenase family)
MKVLVLGSTGGSGRAAVEQLLSQGHEVTAFMRRAVGFGADAGRLRIALGDAMRQSDVERAVEGQDAVIVTLGIRENPLRVRLLGPAHTPLEIRSAGTRNVIAAMRQHGVRKLVVQTRYGVGDTRERLGFLDRLFLALLLKPQIADTEIQNREVIASALDWVIVQPVHLNDTLGRDMPFVSTSGDVGRNVVSRNSVGRFLAHAALSEDFVGKSVALSGRAA